MAQTSSGDDVSPLAAIHGGAQRKAPKLLVRDGAKEVRNPEALQDDVVLLVTSWRAVARRSVPRGITGHAPRELGERKEGKLRLESLGNDPRGGAYCCDCPGLQKVGETSSQCRVIALGGQLTKGETGSSNNNSFRRDFTIIIE